MKSGVERINEERERQIDEGYDPKHDDEHQRMELVSAAVAYLMFNIIGGDQPMRYWPWERKSFHASIDLRDNLTKAGALIAAEIDRLNRFMEADKGK